MGKDSFQADDDPVGESRFRENPCSGDGAFPQEYFVYCKEKGRSRGADCPEDAEGDGVGVCLGFSPSHNRWNAVGGKLDVLLQIEGVDGLDEADAADLEEVVHALPAPGELLHHRQNEPQIAGDQLLPRRLVAGLGPLHQRAGLGAFEHRQLCGVDPADLNFRLHIPHLDSL